MFVPEESLIVNALTLSRAFDCTFNVVTAKDVIVEESEIKLLIVVGVVSAYSVFIIWIISDESSTSVIWSLTELIAATRFVVTSVVNDALSPRSVEIVFVFVTSVDIGSDKLTW